MPPDHVTHTVNPDELIQLVTLSSDRVNTPFNTNRLVLITGSLSAIAWIATLAVGFVLYDALSLGNLVIVITLGWLLLTLGVSYYLIANQQGNLLNVTVWKSWLALSVLASLVNIGAGLMLELGYVSTEVEPIKTVPMEYGVILPWLVVYAVGNLLTAFYNFDNRAALSTNERGVYGGIGIVSALGAGGLFVMPTLHTPAILLLVVLSFIQCITVWIRPS